MIDAAKRISGRDIPIVMGKRREGDPPVLVASAERARRVLGWTPEHSSLDAIITDAWRWHAR